MTVRPTDVFVAGGGPAGLALAIAARQRGLDVVVADARLPSIDKACGEGLLPDAVEALRGLGIYLNSDEGRRFRGIRFLCGEESAAANFPGGNFGLGVRRTTLHRALTGRCEELGVECRWGQPVLGISGNEVRLKDGNIRARWIVGADGAHSRVRRWAGLEPRGPRKFRYAFCRHYEIVPWTDQVEVYWSGAGQVYVTPVSGDQVGVALISREQRVRLRDALAWFPQLAARLSGAPAVSRERGATTGMGKSRRVCAGNVALVGDASGTVDAITGEGLGLGFRQAARLADCLKADELACYQEEHERLARVPRLMGRMLLALDGRPRLQQRIVRAFQSRPQLFDRMLALHVGAPAASFARDTRNWMEPADPVKSFESPKVFVRAIWMALILCATAATAQEKVFPIDSKQTTVQFTLESVLHTVHGSFAVKQGSLRLDAATGKMSGEIIVDARSGDSGNGSRDRKMHHEILESDKYPEITFQPTRMEGALTPQGKSKVQVHGTFSLHGASHEITVPAEVTLTPARWTAAIEFHILYVKWGMKNPSNLFLKVDDSVEIEIAASGGYEQKQ